MNNIKFSFAEAKDLKSVKQLLLECELPYQDIDNHLSHFILAKQDKQLIGVIGLEKVDSYGLLRSLAVSDSHRGKGLAKTLHTRMLAYAQGQGLERFYLLTLTAEGFFSKLGFDRTERKTVPEALRQTEEFRSLCPDTAVCMVKYIAGEDYHDSSIRQTSFEALDPNFESKIRGSFSRQPFMSFIGARLVEVKPGFCQIGLQYNKNLSQQHGFFHGGIIGTIADNSAGYAAFSLMPANVSILTVEYKLNLIAPGDGNLLIGRGQVIKPGRTLTICKSDVFIVKEGVEKLCATALVTLMAMVGKTDKPSN